MLLAALFSASQGCQAKSTSGNRAALAFLTANMAIVNSETHQQLYCTVFAIYHSHTFTSLFIFPSRLMSTKQRRKALKKGANTELLERLASADARERIAQAEDADLFFEDTVGETESRRNVKRAASAGTVSVSSDGTAKVMKEFVPKKPAPKPFSSARPLHSYERARRNERRAKVEAHRSVLAAELVEANMSLDTAISLANSYVTGVAPHAVRVSSATFDAVEDLWADETPAPTTTVTPEDAAAATAALSRKQLQRLHSVASLRSLAAAGRVNKRDMTTARENVLAGGIVVAPAGLSINPRPEDHEALLAVAEERARRDSGRIKRLQRRFNVPSDVDASELPATLEVTPAEERRAAIAFQPRVLKATPRKLRPPLNKERRQRMERHAGRLVAMRARVAKEVDDIPRFIKAAENAEKRTAVRQARGAEHKALHKDRTVSFGGPKFRPAFPEVPLVEEYEQAGGSLRSAPVSNQLATDAFLDLQRRNLIPTPRPMKKQGRERKKRVVPRSGTFVPIEVDEVIARAEASAVSNPRVLAAKGAKGKGAVRGDGAIASATGRKAKRGREFAVPNREEVNAGGYDDAADPLSIFD